MTPTALEAGIRNRRPLCQLPAASLAWSANDAGAATAAALPVHYQHNDHRLGVDFLVHRLPFEGLQALDPRLIRIPPGACNEKHRHAHESILGVCGKTVRNAAFLPLAI